MGSSTPVAHVEDDVPGHPGSPPHVNDDLVLVSNVDEVPPYRLESDDDEISKFGIVFAMSPESPALSAEYQTLTTGVPTWQPVIFDSMHTALQKFVSSPQRVVINIYMGQRPVNPEKFYLSLSWVDVFPEAVHLENNFHTRARHMVHSLQENPSLPLLWFDGISTNVMHSSWFPITQQFPISYIHWKPMDGPFIETMHATMGSDFFIHKPYKYIARLPQQFNSKKKDSGKSEQFNLLHFQVPIRPSPVHTERLPHWRWDTTAGAVKPTSKTQEPLSGKWGQVFFTKLSRDSLKTYVACPNDHLVGKRLDVMSALNNAWNHPFFAIKIQSLIHDTTIVHMLKAIHNPAECQFSFKGEYSVAEAIGTMCASSLRERGVCPMLPRFFACAPGVVQDDDNGPDAAFASALNMVMVMEYIHDARTLKAVSEKMSPLGVWSMLNQLLYGLTALEEGPRIQHQDLTFSNILIRPTAVPFRTFHVRLPHTVESDNIALIRKCGTSTQCKLMDDHQPVREITLPCPLIVHEGCLENHEVMLLDFGLCSVRLQEKQWQSTDTLEFGSSHSFTGRRKRQSTATQASIAKAPWWPRNSRSHMLYIPALIKRLGLSVQVQTAEDEQMWAEIADWSYLLLHASADLEAMKALDGLVLFNLVTPTCRKAAENCRKPPQLFTADPKPELDIQHYLLDVEQWRGET